MRPWPGSIRPRTCPWASAAPPLSSLDEVLVPIQLPPVLQASRPGEDAGDGVGAGRPALGAGRTGELRAKEPTKGATWRQLPTPTRLTGPGPPSQPVWHAPRAYLLVLPIVARDCPVSSLSLDGLSVGADQHGCHQAQGAKAWRVGRTSSECGCLSSSNLAPAHLPSGCHST